LSAFNAGYEQIFASTPCPLLTPQYKFDVRIQFFH
jgi:hypothetical protein